MLLANTARGEFSFNAPIIAGGCALVAQRLHRAMQSPDVAIKTKPDFPREELLMTFKPTRRAVVAGGVAGLAGSMAMDYRAFGQPLPTSPVTLNIVDVAGNLALTQKAIEDYATKNPKLVSRITFTKAPAPELPGKIKAQQDAGRVDIDLVLTGTDALSAGVEQRLLDHARCRTTRRKLPKLDDDLSARRGEDAGARRRTRASRRVHAVRPAARIHARQGEDSCRPRPRSCSPGQGQSEPLHLCAPGQFRARAAPS